MIVPNSDPPPVRVQLGFSSPLVGPESPCPSASPVLTVPAPPHPPLLPGRACGASRALLPAREGLSWLLVPGLAWVGPLPAPPTSTCPGPSSLTASTKAGRAESRGTDRGCVQNLTDRLPAFWPLLGKVTSPLLWSESQEG